MIKNVNPFFLTLILILNLTHTYFISYTCSVLKAQEFLDNKKLLFKELFITKLQ